MTSIEKPDPGAIAAAVLAGQQAFWSTVARRFPEAETGDLPPEVASMFDIACTAAVETRACPAPDELISTAPPRLSRVSQEILAAIAGVESFWNAVAQTLPSVLHAPLATGDQEVFRAACIEAVDWWTRFNVHEADGEPLD
jgi:hypothetical protein